MRSEIIYQKCASDNRPSVYRANTVLSTAAVRMAAVFFAQNQPRQPPAGPCNRPLGPGYRVRKRSQIKNLEPYAA